MTKQKFGLAEIIRDPKAWRASPSFDNSVQKWTGKVRDFIIGVCMAVIIIGVCYIILSPVIGIISRSVMTPEDAMNPLVFLIPQEFTLQNIDFAVQYMDYFQGRGLSDIVFFSGSETPLNLSAGVYNVFDGTPIYGALRFLSGVLSGTLLRTLVFAGFFSFLNVIICSMVGYGFARFKFPGVEILFALVILTIVVPVHSYMVPLFINFRYFLDILPGAYINLIDSWWSLGLLTATGVGIRSGLYIYIFRQFFRGLPKEIEEAAFIDGAGPLGTYVKVMMPNSVPAIVTVLLFAFVWHYNDTFYTSLLMPRVNLMPTSLMSLPMAFSAGERVQSLMVIEMVTFAGVMLAIVPILTLYLFLQRYFVEGLERSGIVG